MPKRGQGIFILIFLDPNEIKVEFMPEKAIGLVNGSFKNFPNQGISLVLNQKTLYTIK